MTARRVLDAPALLAWLHQELGADVVDPLLSEGAVSTANWSEVLQKVAQRGRDAREINDLPQALGVEPVVERPHIVSYTRQRLTCPDIVRSGLAAPVSIDGVAGDWVIDPDALATMDTPLPARTMLLSPFDRLIHDRDRTEALY